MCFCTNHKHGSSGIREGVRGGRGGGGFRYFTKKILKARGAKIFSHSEPPVSIRSSCFIISTRSPTSISAPRSVWLLSALKLVDNKFSLISRKGEGEGEGGWEVKKVKQLNKKWQFQFMNPGSL